jgi:hypothetical protein
MNGLNSKVEEPVPNSKTERVYSELARLTSKIDRMTENLEATTIALLTPSNPTCQPETPTVDASSEFFMEVFGRISSVNLALNRLEDVIERIEV